MQQIWTLKFLEVVRQHTTPIYCFVGNLTDFPAVKEFWKSVKIWRSYPHSRVACFFETGFMFNSSQGQITGWIDRQIVVVTDVACNGYIRAVTALATEKNKIDNDNDDTMQTSLSSIPNECRTALQNLNRFVTEYDN